MSNSNVFNRRQESCLGKMKGNIVGNKLTMYDSRENPNKVKSGDRSEVRR